MYKYGGIKNIFLEITEKCNASCLQCSRINYNGKINPHLKMRELRLQDTKKIFKKKFIRQLDAVIMCGNYGEPILAKDFLDICKYFRSVSPKVEINLHTNGFYHTQKWWIELAKVIGFMGKVNFALDGLRDTHGIYRQGIDWKTVIKNAQSYIHAGGQAIWVFLVFEHNEHQVEKAKKLSQQMGFASFEIKKTARFYSHRARKVVDFQKIIGIKEKEIILKKPKQTKYINKALLKEKKIIKKYKSFENYFHQTKINCKAQKQKSIYISAEGIVLPCCWLGGNLYTGWLPLKSTPIWKYIEKTGGLRKFNVLKTPLKKIIENNFFQEDLPKNWKSKNKLEICSRNCGQEYNPFEGERL